MTATFAAPVDQEPAEFTVIPETTEKKGPGFFSRAAHASTRPVRKLASTWRDFNDYSMGLAYERRMERQRLIRLGRQKREEREKKAQDIIREKLGDSHE